jgi:hypothetical protein
MMTAGGIEGVRSTSLRKADMRNLVHFVVVPTEDSWKNTGGKNSDSWMLVGEVQKLRRWKEAEGMSTVR